MSPDGRWFVVEASSRQNARAARVWPRIGCIGSAVNSLGVKREMDCVAYQGNFVGKEAYLEFGNAKDAGGIDIWSESPIGNSVVRCQSISTSDQPE